MKIIKATILIIILVSIAITAFAVNLFGSNDADNQNLIKKESMIQSTLEWGRLAPIPRSKTSFNIFTEGSSFTRSFRASFNLNNVDLEKWIKESPGLQDAEVQVKHTKKTYIIKPGGGANYAETVIDTKNHFIEIYVSWS